MCLHYIIVHVWLLFWVGCMYKVAILIIGRKWEEHASPHLPPSPPPMGLDNRLNLELLLHGSPQHAHISKNLGQRQVEWYANYLGQAVSQAQMGAIKFLTESGHAYWAIRYSMGASTFSYYATYDGKIRQFPPAKLRRLKKVNGSYYMPCTQDSTQWVGNGCLLTV